MQNSILIEITSGAAFLQSLLLFFHPHKINTIANRWLGIFVFTLALSLLEISLVGINFQNEYPKLFEIIGICRFLTAPALYMSILHFTSIYHNFKKAQLWHFLPFVLILLYRLPFFINGQNPVMSDHIRGSVLVIIQLILPVQAIGYWISSFIRLNKHQRRIIDFSSMTTRIDLEWLKVFLIATLIIIITWFNLLYFNLILLVHLTPILYFLSIIFLAYYSLKQKEIYEFSSVEKQDLAELEMNKNNVQRQRRMDAKKTEILNEKLKYLMEEEKIYLENELSLPELASRLGVSANEISYFINEVHRENFYNFVNSYRIVEAKKLLLSDVLKTNTILGIAYQSGFNSKTAFNAAFKKATGCSPTEFINKNSNREKE